MTLPELFEHALSDNTAARCWSLIMMFADHGEDMPVGDVLELERLVDHFGLDLEAGGDAAHWSPDSQNVEGS